MIKSLDWNAVIVALVSGAELYLGHSSLADLPDDQPLSTNHPGPAALIHLHRDLVVSYRDQHTQSFLSCSTGTGDLTKPDRQEQKTLKSHKKKCIFPTETMFSLPSAIVSASINLTGSDEPKVCTS